MLHLIAFCLIIVSSCKKPEKGDPGPAGKDGNANVKSITHTITNWTYSSPTYIGNIPFASITNEIINSGAVLVYAQTAANTYSQLPLTFYASTSYSSTLEVVTSPGMAQIGWTDSDLTQPATPPSMTFKVVAIASSAISENPDIDYSNYNVVKSVFNITE